MAVRPSWSAVVAVRLKARKTKCRAMPAAKTAVNAEGVTGTLDTTALLICIQGTRMSSMELRIEVFFLLLSTNWATAAKQHKL